MAQTSTTIARATVQTHHGDLAKLFQEKLPQAIEAECALLGSMILDWRVVGEVVQILNGEDDFCLRKHGALYHVLVEMYDQNQSLDMVQVKHRLDDLGLLDQVGGVEYLVELAESVPSASSAAYYARIVGEKAVLRRLIDAAGQILRDAYSSADSVGTLLDQAEQLIFGLADSRVSDEATELKVLLQETYARLEAHDGTQLTGLDTGYFELNEMTNGLQNGEMIIVAARPSMGKCLSHDAEIVLSDGTLATIEDICTRKKGGLLTLSGDWKFAMTKPSHFINDGVKPVFRVTTRLGRKVKTTLTHPFLTVEGWRPLGELHVGASVAVPRQINVFGTASLGDHKVKILAYLLGDGGLTNSCPRFTNSSAMLREDFTDAIRQFGGLQVCEESSGGTRTISLSVSRDDEHVTVGRQHFSNELRQTLSRPKRSARQVAHQIQVSPATLTHWCQGKTVPNSETFSELCQTLGVSEEALAPSGLTTIQRNTPNALTQWLDELDIGGKNAHGKFIPEVIFTLQKEEVALFLNRLFATDGWATVLTSGQSQIGFSSVSEQMIHQVQHLLLRFGVIASVRKRSMKYAGTRRSAFQLDVTDAKSIRVMIEDIGIFGKESAVERVAVALDDRRYQTNCDLIPKEIWRQIEQLRQGASWRSIADQMGLSRSNNNLHVGQRALSRDRLWRFAEALGSQPLRDLATSDVYWDEIVSIEYVGQEQVYDLTIPETHNFVANDICVHNTALALNIAEHIASDQHQPVAVFSLEMSKQQLAQRLLCSRGGVDSQKVRKHNLSADEFGQLALVVGELSEAPLFIDDTPSLSLLGLRAKARRLAARHDIKAVIVDYLQLMTSPKSESRQQEVSSLSRGIKAMARELNVPVICLSQLNRSSEGREGHRPRMSDLRESGSIEQDADVVMLLHREDYYRRDEEDHIPDNTAELIVAKRRNGPTGTVKLQFHGPTMRFNNLAATNHRPSF